MPLSNLGKIKATSTAEEADDYSKLINEISGYRLIQLTHIITNEEYPN